MLREAMQWGVSGYYLKEEELPDPPVRNWARLNDGIRSLEHGHWKRVIYWGVTGRSGTRAGK